MPAPIVLSIFVFTFGYTFGVLTIPLVASLAHLDPASIGFVIAVPGLFGLALLFVGLVLNALHGERNALLVSFALLAGAGALLASRSEPLLVPGAVLLGLASALFWPSALTILSKSGGERRQAEGAVAQGLASLAAGVLVAAHTPAQTTVAALVAVGVAGISLTMRVSATPSAAPSEVTGVVRTIGARTRAVLAQRDSLVSTLATFPFSVLWWVGGTSFMVLYVAGVGLPGTFAGLVVAVRTGAATMLRVAYPMAARRIGVVRLWVIGNLVAAAGIALVPLSATPTWLIVCAVVQGCGLSVVVPALNSMAASATSDTHRTVGYALPYATAQLAILVMPLPLGWLASSAGVGASLVAAGLTGAASAVVLSRIATMKHPVPAR